MYCFQTPQKNNALKVKSACFQGYTLSAPHGALIGIVRHKTSANHFLRFSLIPCHRATTVTQNHYNNIHAANTTNREMQQVNKTCSWSCYKIWHCMLAENTFSKVYRLPAQNFEIFTDSGFKIAATWSMQGQGQLWQCKTGANIYTGFDSPTKKHAALHNAHFTAAIADVRAHPRP